MTRTALIAAGLLAAATAANAQAPAAPPAAAPAAAPVPPIGAYGPNITLDQAKKVAAAAKAEADKRKLPMTLAIVDTAGQLIYFERATDAVGTAEAFAMKKAYAAVRKRAPTSNDQLRAKTGGPEIAYIPDFFPFGGGQPIVVDGKVIGAVGETGGADDDVAKAGVAALK
jgi:uncharacterized protein GlcG (DUF336 family)